MTRTYQVTLRLPDRPDLDIFLEASGPLSAEVAGYEFAEKYLRMTPLQVAASDGSHLLKWAVEIHYEAFKMPVSRMVHVYARDEADAWVKAGAMAETYFKVTPKRMVAQITNA